MTNDRLENEIINTIRNKSFVLHDQEDLQPLYDLIGDSRIVMLGEASHGTHEYYTWRANISKKLIREKRFSFIAVEGDWPDCYKVNRYAKGYEAGRANTLSVLHEFDRWPTWMWANWEIEALIQWLKNYNKGLPLDRRVGFYGLDVYSLWESMESIMQYLEHTDKEALNVAEKAFQCFEPYRQDEGRSYAQATRFVPELCTDEVVDLLTEIRRKIAQYNTDYENVFSAEQNALITVNAEKYYRAMIEGGGNSWNVRDTHMAETLDRLLNFHGKQSKAIVWEHNTHIGDARATDMARDGMYNIGQIARDEHADKGVILVGFGSYEGSVMAGKSWGATMQKMKMPKARKGSWEYLLHEAGPENKLLIMSDYLEQEELFENPIGHRAIGVVYHPEFEQFGNYVPSILPMRYDAFIYLDKTSAVHPLHIKPDGHQMPETYPFGV